MVRLENNIIDDKSKLSFNTLKDEYNKTIYHDIDIITINNMQNDINNKSDKLTYSELSNWIEKIIPKSIEVIYLKLIY